MSVGCEPVRVWSRLELRTRQVELDRVLQARIADPLWMLTRQWQFGEFQGDDTGSAVSASLARTVGVLTELSVDGTARPYHPQLPLDAQVEALALALPRAVRARAGSCLLAELARRWQQVSITGDVAGAGRALAAAYPLDAGGGSVDSVEQARRRCAGAGGRVAQALAGRGVDGIAAARAMPATAAWTDLPPGLRAAVPPGGESATLAAVHAHAAWVQELFLDPGTAADAWDGAALGYRFDATVRRPDGSQVHLRGATGATGGVSWHDLDLVARTQGTPGGTSTVAVTMPAPAQFAGMPNPRWWQLEDAAVSLNRLRADAGDLTKLVATEFALLYSNDWMLIGDVQELGTLVEIEGIVVTDVFGHRTLVRAATGSSGTDWAGWDLFSVSPARERGPGPLEQHLWAPPSSVRPLDGPVLEEAVFVRDEATNTVWAVETRVPNGLGGGRDGADVARQMAAALTPAASPDSGGADTGGSEALWRYRLGTTVPENWIPFLPVHGPDSNRSVVLQRASMPRFTPDLPPNRVRVRPVTSILREHITDGDVQLAAYYVNEEEVSRAGRVVRGRLRRARWVDGRSVVWHARDRASGRGEGSSGLQFDLLEPRAAE
jgi:hypothetical protein